MSSIEATKILDIIAMVVSRLRVGATELVKSTHTNNVNALTTHFPFKARAVITHDKPRNPHEDEVSWNPMHNIKRRY